MVLCRWLLGIGPNPSTKDAELIAFRVCEYHPRRVTLLDIGPPSTEGNEKFDFCGLIDRTGVRMESVLACLPLGSYRKNRVFCRMSSGAGTANQEPTAGEPAVSGQGRVVWWQPRRAERFRLPQRALSAADPHARRSEVRNRSGSGDRRCRAGAIGRPRQPRGYYGGRGVSTLGRGA